MANKRTRFPASLTIRLTELQKEILSNYCLEKDLSESEVARLAVREFLERNGLLSVVS